ncbi:MAG: uroporphyrinogen decarboxylase family protein [Candidatus Methanospirareceae archaeon]
MNEYERMRLIVEGKTEELDRVPCAGYGIGVFTTESLKPCNVTWSEALKTPEGLAKVVSYPHRACGLESIHVPIDIIIEAEAIGLLADLREKQAERGKYLWPNIKVREVTTTGIKLEKPENLLEAIPDDVANAGRVPVITGALKILHEEFYGKVPVSAGIIGPFMTLSGYVLDTVKFYTKCRTDPEEVKEWYKASSRLTVELAKIYREAGADLISIREDGLSCDCVHPDFFRYMKPLITEVFKKTNAEVLTMSGAAGPIVKDCAEVGAKILAIDEKTSVAQAKKDAESMKPKYKMAIQGNLPTMALLGKKGTGEKIRSYVKKIIEEGVDVVAHGSDFFINTPLENIKIMVEATKEYGVKK